jgi:ABC-type phosphate transport system substrate-binding protein
VVTAKRSTWCAAAFALSVWLGSPALADVVAVVSAKSQVDHLSKKELADLFLGRTARLPDGSQVMPVDQEEGSPARSEFYTEFVGKSPAQMREHWSKIIFTGRGKPPFAVANDAATRKLVAGNPHAIGYIDRSQLDNSVKVLRVD